MSKWCMRLITALVLSLALAGCKTELYSKLSEQEANEMLAILSDAGIAAEKVMDKDGLVSLQIEADQFSTAVTLLKQRGYPREQFATLGEVFLKDGMISSPMEERARYNYALSQELSATLSLIDGVHKARVHVVLPENDAYGKATAVPSASVFIKHAAELPIESLTPRIKSLVANSVEGLAYANISVSLFPEIQVRTPVREAAAQDSGPFGLNTQAWYATLAGGVLLVVAVVILLMWRRAQRGSGATA